MKTLLLGLITALACNLAQAVEVTATGYGSSFNESLQNAKVLATEYAASTFLTGKQELTDGKYKEILGQYNGGLVQKYTVKNTVVNAGVYAVTIQADVNIDKINKIIADGESSPSVAVPQVEKVADEYRKTEAALVTINQVSNPFVMVVDNSKYTISDGRRVDIVYQLHLVWNPKWVDDVKQLARTIGRPIAESQKGVCFGPKRASKYACGGMTILPDSDMWKRIYFNIVIDYNDGTTETRQTLTMVAVELFTYNWEQRINNESSSTTANRNAAQVIGAIVPTIGTLISGLAVNSNYSVIETLTIHPDTKTSQFKSYVTSLNIEQFKKISKVSFVPAVDQAGCWKNNHC